MSERKTKTEKKRMKRKLQMVLCSSSATDDRCPVEAFSIPCGDRLPRGSSRLSWEVMAAGGWVAGVKGLVAIKLTLVFEEKHKRLFQLSPDSCLNKNSTLQYQRILQHTEVWLWNCRRLWLLLQTPCSARWEEGNTVSTPKYSLCVVTTICSYRFPMKQSGVQLLLQQQAVWMCPGWTDDCVWQASTGKRQGQVGGDGCWIILAQGGGAHAKPIVANTKVISTKPRLLCKIFWFCSV